MPTHPTITNGIITVGVSTDHGGAITTLLDNNVPSVNLINCHDQGREIQQSYYAGPDPYRGAQWSGHPWPWNPISAGDFVGHHGTVLNLTVTATSIYVKSQPLQWALDNVPCNCTFESWITLDENGFLVRHRLVTFREDKTKYGRTGQELPAVYVIGQLYNLWTYTGSQPFAGEPLTQVAYPVPGPPWQSFTANENWAAFTDDIPQKYGVGVQNLGTTQFLGGFHGPQGQGGSTDDSTGYIAPLGDWAIRADDERIWCFRIAIGYLVDIRSYFNQRRGPDC